ncbi:FtsX-like permease family protein [Prolixibacteraceae bacterium JC049]|nr:FtsX-like permease family protein [Prolixibacteraceae bacterium JC049]
MKLKVAFRSIARFRLNSLIIVGSLAVGMACMSLITMFILKEYNADSFHKKGESIYALQADDPFTKGNRMYVVRDGATEYMKENYSEVVDFCKIKNATPTKVTVNRQDYFSEKSTLAVSPNFFQFFSYELVKGNPQEVLATKESVVISENLSQKYFGDSYPIGQIIKTTDRGGEKELLVSGVFSKPIGSSQLKFDMVTRFNSGFFSCYLMLAEDASVAQLEKQFSENRANIPIVHDGTIGTYYLQDLQTTYFDAKRTRSIHNSRDKSELHVAAVIALLILLIATFNFWGLMNSYLSEKSQEYMVRKINGGTTYNVLSNLIYELILLLLASFVLSCLLIGLALPFFNQLTGSSITLRYFIQVSNLIYLAVIPLTIFAISLGLSWLKVDRILARGGIKSALSRTKANVQFPVFNIAQLGITVVLIIGSFIIMKQINYITNKDIGLKKEVIEVKIPRQFKGKAPVFKQQLEKYNSIKFISIANASPLLEHYVLMLHYKENGLEKKYAPALFEGDNNYCDALGIELIRGEGFKGNESDKSKCIINQSLAKLFPNKNLIGEKLPGDKEKTVIGIARDFHYGSLKNIVEPGYISCGSGGHYLMVNPQKGQEAEARKVIANIWDELIPDFPLNVETIGERHEWIHRENTNYAKLIGACCFISIFLSMIGLFALSFNTSLKRTKEIGIRKVNGAKILEILTMLNKDFVKWVVIAFVLACPLAWFVMNKWLENFAYKTTLSWWIFALAGFASLIIALLTVSWQSWRAATRNPVESLRYE